MKTKSFKEILKETIQRNCTDDYDGMFLFFESSVIEAHNEYASQFQQEWIPVEVETAREPIQDALYATERFTTVECSVLSDGILMYLKDRNFAIAKPQPYNPT